ncbi:hypothetical protein QL996_14100 [Planococcus sp. APC 4015]|nr:hypothetical protein [Planococcus sp. APC 4015]
MASPDDAHRAAHALPGRDVPERLLSHGRVLIAWADAGTADPSGRRGVADALLAKLVAALGESGTIGRLCPTCGSTMHGRPVVDAPVALSLGYAGALVAAAAARTAEAASVGIDIEPDDREVGDLRALFAPRDAPDLAGWTRIEAVLKADGRGIRLDPSRVVIEGAQATHPGPFEVATIDGPAGHIISVAVAAPAPR